MSTLQDVTEPETDDEPDSDDDQFDTNKEELKDIDSGAETGTARSPSPSADETPNIKKTVKKKQRPRVKSYAIEKRNVDSINEFSKQIEKHVAPVQQKGTIVVLYYNKIIYKLFIVLFSVSFYLPTIVEYMLPFTPFPIISKAFPIKH